MKLPENIQYEPMRQNRFIVEFPEQFGIQLWHVSTASKPKYSGSKWENMEVTFIDPIGPPSTSHLLFKLIETLEILQKVKSSDSPIFMYKLMSLDPTGVVVETWEISVGEVLSVDFGKDLDYSSDELQMPKIVMRPMYCVLKSE
jgi:hypothetical protein